MVKYYPGYIIFQVNTLDPDDLTKKLNWCEVELEKTPIADSSRYRWLTNMAEWLQQLLSTVLAESEDVK